MTSNIYSAHVLRFIWQISYEKIFENNPIHSSYNITHLNHELEEHIPNSFMRAHILWFQNIRHVSKLKCRKAHNIMNEEKERRCKYFQFKITQPQLT